MICFSERTGGNEDPAHAEKERAEVELIWLGDVICDFGCLEAATHQRRQWVETSNKPHIPLR
jgi:hypothetical protein